MLRLYVSHFFFFFTHAATTEIYTLSLHDALPIYLRDDVVNLRDVTDDLEIRVQDCQYLFRDCAGGDAGRSEEHTSELQSRRDLVCRLLLEKKKKKMITTKLLPTECLIQLNELVYA